MRLIIRTAILATLLIAHPVYADLYRSPSSFHVVDTISDLEWRISDVRQVGYNVGDYNDVLSRYDAGSPYRFPTQAEVVDLVAQFFPGFVGNDRDGRCAQTVNGGAEAYPGQVAQVDAFIALFGHNYHAIYENSAGELRGLWVRDEYSVHEVCPTGYFADYAKYRNDPPYPSTALDVMVVRGSVTLASSLTVFNYLHPADVGLSVVETFNGGSNPCIEDMYGGGYTDTGWDSLGGPGYFCWYDNSYIWNSEFSLAAYPSTFNEKVLAPWVRINSLEYTGSCDAADTDIGGGWCRRDYSNGWQYTGETVIFAGTYIANQGSVDNIQIDQLWENAVIDFEAWNASNEVRPKDAYFVTVMIKTTSMADGDAYDLNAADVDPASLRLGRENAEITGLSAVLPGDYDGDGDTDYVFGFRIENTGVTCVDDRIRLAGRTYAGDPIAGSDDIYPINCQERIDIDVDPFNTVNTIRPDDDYNIVVALLGMRQAAGDLIDFYPERERTQNTVYSADGLDRNTLRFGPAATPLVGAPIVTDINGDSHDDLLVNFNVFDAGIACEDTEVAVSGKKNSGIPIEGLNAIVTEDCSTGSCHP